MMQIALSMLLAGVFIIAASITINDQPRQMSSKSIYDYSFLSIDGKEVSLQQYKGKKILFVNVASKCGFTPQYEELEKLSKRYADQLVVIGFPANDFFGQEPGTNDEIASFCKLNYGVTFPISQKISVTGDSKHPIYQWLTTESLNGWNSSGPKWNFYKYLVNEKGELLDVFASTVKPLNKSIVELIEKKPNQ